MALLWNDPHEWVTDDAVTKERLNEIGDDLLYLMNPSRTVVTVRGTGTNQTNTLTSFQDLDPSVFTISVELTGKRTVRVKMEGMVSNSVSAAFTYIDVLIDSSTYLSSLTATAIATGVKFFQAGSAGGYTPVSFEVLIPAGTLAAGVHTFRPVWKVSSGTGTFYENTVLAQFSAGE